MIEADMPLWLKGHAWRDGAWSAETRVALGVIDHAYVGNEAERQYVEFLTGRGVVWRCYLDVKHNRQIIEKWIIGE